MRLLVRRTAAGCIAVAMFFLFFGSFILAEGDAYAPGHNGYIHAPWILGYGLAIILAGPAAIVITNLWQR